MKKTIKISALLAILLLSVLMIVACSSGDAYKKINKQGYNVSVKFDIGDGMFAGRSELVLVDAFNLDNEKTNADGKKEITVIAPDSSLRGSEAFEVAYSGHYFVGWYQNRQEIKDADGNTSYTYSGLWDFSKDKLTLDPNGSYSADEPVLTLYAAWVPLTDFEIYIHDSNGQFGDTPYTTITSSSLEIPTWNKSTGKLSTTNFPSFEGKTFDSAYYDIECTQPITDSSILGNINFENGTLNSDTVKVYVKTLEGSWYKIYTAEALVKLNDKNGNYQICADLDFSSVAWKNTTFAKETFEGTIYTDGQVHKFSNIYAFYSKENNATSYGGLFKAIGENATIKNIEFENITYTISEVSNKTNLLLIGLFAGEANDNAIIENVTFTGTNKVIVKNDCLKQVQLKEINSVFGKGDDRNISNDNFETVND